jgi:hypothetical protein
MTFGRGDIDLGFGPDSYFRVRDASGVRGKRRSDLNTIPPAGCGVGSAWAIPGDPCQWKRSLTLMEKNRLPVPSPGPRLTFQA